MRCAQPYSQNGGEVCEHEPIAGSDKCLLHTIEELEDPAAIGIAQHLLLRIARLERNVLDMKGRGMPAGTVYKATLGPIT